MGYVQSASTVTLRARLTQKGREELLSGTTQLTVKYFALGDGDANYRTTSVLSTGKVPDVTGDYSGCTLSLADGVGLHHPISLTGGTNPSTVKLAATTATTTSLLFGCGSPSDLQFSANTLTCDVYVNRLMNAENKILYDWYSNAASADSLAFNFSISGPTPKESIPGQPTNPIQFSGTNNGTVVVLGGEPYANFYDFVYINKKHVSKGVVTNTQEFDDVDIEFAKPVDRYLWELINNVLPYKDTTEYPYDNNSSYTIDYTNIIRTDEEKPLELKKPATESNPLSGALLEFPVSQIEISPMVTSFSSLSDSKIPNSAKVDSGVYNASHILGAGAGGLMVSAREYGYYAEFRSNKPLKGFLPTSLVEQNYADLFSNEVNSGNIYPCVRVKPYLGVNETLRSKGASTKYPYNTLGTKEAVFIYDAFSGYDKSGTLKYDFFYDGTGRRDFPTSNEVLFTMDKLRYDPFNPQHGNSLGSRGFSNNTYKPSELELTQMTAFDHIVTQGRLLRLDVDPFIDWDVEGDASDIYVNEGFGCVGNGGVGPNGTFYSKTHSGGLVTATYGDGEGEPSGQPDGVVTSKNFIFNTETDGTSYLKRFSNNTSEYWHTSLQGFATNYGLTLLNYERKMVDTFFDITYQGLSPISEFGRQARKDGDEYIVTINLKYSTKNIKDDNGAPYTAFLKLNFRNTRLRDDSPGSRVAPSGASDGWGYVNNISPIIVRTIPNT